MRFYVCVRVHVRVRVRVRASAFSALFVCSITQQVVAIGDATAFVLGQWQMRREAEAAAAAVHHHFS